MAIKVRAPQGILDTRGQAYDDANMAHIMEYLNFFPRIHGIVILLNQIE